MGFDANCWVNIGEQCIPNTVKGNTFCYEMLYRNLILGMDFPFTELTVPAASYWYNASFGVPVRYGGRRPRVGLYQAIKSHCFDKIGELLD